MIIEEFVRDEANEIFAIVAGEKIHLTVEYVATHKPQIGDTLVETAQPVEAVAPVEEAKTEFNNTVLAIEGEQVLGSVIVTRESRANGRHRGEFRKLLVHSSAQKLGIGSALEQAATEYARSIGLSLLFLDSATNFLVKGVYEKWGWKMSGEIPQYAKNPDGVLVSTWFFYKLLNTEK